MNTLERQAIILTGPWILFDGTCAICRAGEARFGRMVRCRGFRLATLQSRIGREFDVPSTDEMKVITRDGAVLGGAEGFVHICSYIWWATPMALLWKIPLAQRGLRNAYQWVAANRHCANASCEIDTPTGGAL
jgi:predicted DCC family thiol-disulfide oxidoreductase YuxK